MPTRRSRRNIHRLRQIADIAADHGFGYFIAKIGLASYLSSKYKKRHIFKIPSKDIGIHIRTLLEDLGPTFVKLGQLLSVRPDLTPPNILAELEKLQDTVPPFDWQDVENTVYSEFGKNIDELYASFDQEPIASASIGQVHRATLFDGTTVAVKIRRPDIETSIDADLDMLEYIAGILKNRIEFLDPLMVLSEFKQSLDRELDYTNEARFADRFAQIFKDDHIIKIPKVYWDLTTRKVLTTEFINGVKISDLANVSAQGHDYPKLARLGAEAFMRQVLEYGFFHGDLHPGNVLITPDGKIAYLDFGIVGEIDDRDREAITMLLMAIIRKDTTDIIHRLNDLGVAITSERFEPLRQDLGKALEKYYGLSLDKIKMAQIGKEFLHIVYSHHIKIPRSYALLVKALITIEGVASILCPDINMIDLTKPYVEKLVKKHYLKSLTSVDYAEQLRILSTLAIKGPSLVLKIIEALASGEMLIRFEDMAASKKITENARLANIIASSIIMSAVFIGSSIVLASRGPAWFYAGGFSICIVTLIYIIGTIRRH